MHKHIRQLLVLLVFYSDRSSEPAYHCVLLSTFLQDIHLDIQSAHPMLMIFSI